MSLFFFRIQVDFYTRILLNPLGTRRIAPKTRRTSHMSPHYSPHTRRRTDCFYLMLLFLIGPAGTGPASTRGYEKTRTLCISGLAFSQMTYI
ncbi:hypothetical protein LY78DRAFT_467875 [Colletotrichum sublineola]|nr:hypothetical protein LY78DRAFT_467875 [Colletotrichum sublineola]